MFEQGYPYALRTISKERGQAPLLRKHVYSFLNKNSQKYIVHIHEYEQKVFIIKFYLNKHKNHPDKYNLVVHEFDFGRTLRTILNITMEVLQKEPLASFAFVGVHKIGSPDTPITEVKSQENNQRYRVYKQVTENFFGQATFLHGYSGKTNSYLLVNRSNNDPEEMYKSIVQMFSNQFQDLGNL